jgi:ribosomal protein S18 acetylase RimI-like enzyme
MIIRLAEKEDVSQIVEIHREEIKSGFLSSLNGDILARIYLSAIESKNNFCIVAEENKEIIGFIAGTINIDKFYSNFIKKYFFSAVFALLPQIFNFRKLKKIIEVLIYPAKERHSPEAELLAVAVKKYFRGQGIAQQMLDKFISEMKNKRINDFKVVVGEKLLPAIKFYEKSGFKFLRNINIHKNDNSRVYVYSIR